MVYIRFNTSEKMISVKWADRGKNHNELIVMRHESLVSNHLNKKKIIFAMTTICSPVHTVILITMYSKE